jgi:UDP-N-acetylmuramyl pentapeptide phosphotransferase/UDP-N-acetylglucosamine-1-phosphate transferase
MQKAEQLRKAKPSGTPRYGGCFFSIPICIVLGFVFIRHGKEFLERVNEGLLFMAFVLASLLFAFGTLLWQEHVPVAVQVLSAVLAWSAMVWLFF